MANFKEDAAREYDWEAGGVYVIEPEDPVEGGGDARWRQETLGEGEPLELELQPWTQETVEAIAP